MADGAARVGTRSRGAWNQPRRRTSMRSTSDSPEIPGGVLVVVGSSGQMSLFLTIRGDSNSISLPSVERRAAPATSTFLSQWGRGRDIGVKREPSGGGGG